MRRWLTALWRVRLWLAVALVVLAVIVRLALPSILRRTVASQASKALHTEVEVGDVALSLWRGTVGLHDVAVYPPAAGGAARTALIGWKALDVELSYADLIHRTIRLREVVLDTPRVALDRLANGELNLQKLVPTPTPSEAAAPAPSPGASGTAPKRGWGFAIDRFVLRGGGMRFRDLAVPQSQPLEMAIPAVEVADVSLQPGAYDQPTQLALDVRSEGSRMRMTAKLRLLERGVSVEADLQANGLPLRRARLYVPGVGWSDLGGLADASLRYRLETEKMNEIRGSITVRDLKVMTPALKDPALAWQQLVVRLDPIDLLARSAKIEAVELGGASVVASLQGGEILPLVAGKKEERTEAPVAVASPSAAVAQATAEPPTAKPWRWSVGKVHVESSKLLLERPDAPLAVGVALSANDLAPDANAVAGIELGLTIGEGSVEAAGRLRLSPPAFGGTLRYAKLDLRELISAVPTLPQRLLQSALLGGELTVEAGIDAGGQPAAADSLRLRGALQVDKLQVSAADPKAFSAGWKRFEIDFDDVRVPGVLAPVPEPPRDPLRVVIANLRIDEPWANLTRTPQGLVLPAVGNAPDDRKAPAKPAPAPAEAKPPAPAPPPEVRIAAIKLRAGRLRVLDRTVKPFFSGEINPLDLDARNVASKGPAVERFRLSATGFQGGKLEVKGALHAAGDGTVEIDGKRVGLMAFNPYVSSASAYSLGRGSLSIASKVTFTRDHYDTQNHVTVHELALQGAEGDTLFRRNFGIPLSTALALLTDLHGDIQLDVPVQVDKGAAKVDLAAVVASALKSAILGAVVSPLKILGAVAGLGGGSATIEPQPIACLVGRADPTAEAMGQIDQLASLLASRPGIGLDLVGQVAEADARWLREQKLRAKLEAGPGVVGSVTGLPTRNARKRILQALGDRANNQPGDLSQEDAALLEKWLKDVAAPSAEEIRALARGRAERVAGLLRDEHGIDAGRLRASAPDVAEAGSAGPNVRVTIGLPAT